MCSQGLDYRLEDFNKKFKKYLHTLFHNFEDWVTVYSNTPALDEMDKAMKGDYGTQRENREVFGPDYKSRVEICRKEIRASQILSYATQSSLLNLEANKISIQSLDLVSACQESKKKYLKNIVNSKSFVKAPNPDFSHFLPYLDSH